jgi:hypothetical protein
MRYKTFFYAAGAAILFMGKMTLAYASGPPDSGEPAKAVLIELFTSEGCSSCPPADDLLRQINGRRTDSGQLIIGVSEHVTYWNAQGWTDPFSLSVSTERQDEYGRRFGLESVYTPQMIINGETQIVGSDSAALLHALKSETPKESLSVQIVKASIENNVLNIDFTVTGSAPGHGADIFAILAEDETTSKVLHGENSGRTLSHVSVARSITRIASIKTSTERNVHLPLSTSAQVPSGQGRHLILFAQASGLGRVLGIDTKPLE